MSWALNSSCVVDDEGAFLVVETVAEVSVTVWLSLLGCLMRGVFVWEGIAFKMGVEGANSTGQTTGGVGEDEEGPYHTADDSFAPEGGTNAVKPSES